MAPEVLIVEDEPSLVELLTYNFERAGFRVRKALDGEDALVRVAERAPDLLVLDWMLPKVSGIEICRRLRRQSATVHLPIILLTARAEESDRLRGLDTGADDYVTKPFSVAELIARAKALLRRSLSTGAGEKLVFADVEMDVATLRVSRAGRPLELNPNEFRLLRYLLEHPKRVFAREQLLDRVWGGDAEVEPRTVDVAVRRLRKALNGPGEVDLIRTARSSGYALDYVGGTNLTR